MGSDPEQGDSEFFPGTTIPRHRTDDSYPSKEMFDIFGPSPSTGESAAAPQSN